MLANVPACYAVFRAHDPRFDGRLYVGVSSTHIYCRPVCRVKMPKIDNCTYFLSAAAAEAAGYRPCLRCRPELAPGLAPVDAQARVAQRAAHIIEDGLLSDSHLSHLAQSLGISGRHLRRIFALEYGVSPVQYLQTKRLLLTKSLLTETALPITTVAMSAGFGSVRRFNACFLKHYRLTPSRLRREKRNLPDIELGISLMVGYRPPFAWDDILKHLKSYCIPGIESVKRGVYRRTIAIEDGALTYKGWLSITNKPARNSLVVKFSESLLPVLPKLLSTVRRVFDMDCDPTDIYGKICTVNSYIPDAFKPGMRLIGCFSPAEAAVRLLAVQRFTVEKALEKIGERVSIFSTKAQTPYAQLTHYFPTVGEMALIINEPWTAAAQGVLEAVSTQYMQNFTSLINALAANEITLDKTADPLAQIEKMQTLAGLTGPLAEQMAMLTLQWPDSFPFLKQQLDGVFPNAAQAARDTIIEGWRPWRSYITAILQQRPLCEVLDKNA